MFYEEMQIWCCQKTHFFFQKKEEIKCSCENFQIKNTYVSEI